MPKYNIDGWYMKPSKVNTNSFQYMQLFLGFLAIVCFIWLVRVLSKPKSLKVDSLPPSTYPNQAMKPQQPGGKFYVNPHLNNNGTRLP